MQQTSHDSRAGNYTGRPLSWSIRRPRLTRLKGNLEDLGYADDICNAVTKLIQLRDHQPISSSPGLAQRIGLECRHRAVAIGVSTTVLAQLAGVNKARLDLFLLGLVVSARTAWIDQVLVALDLCVTIHDASATTVNSNGVEVE